MSNLNEKWAPVTIFAVTLMLTMAPILSGPVLANKKRGTSDLTNPSMTVAATTAQYQLKGKVLNVNLLTLMALNSVYVIPSLTTLLLLLQLPMEHAPHPYLLGLIKLS